MSTTMIVCVVSIFGLAPSAAQAPYEVGQYWRYNHQGPRPGATEPKAIDGERILHVIGTVGTGPEQQWIIEDRFTNDPNIVGRLQVRGDRMLTAIVIENEKGESLTLSYSEPVPYQTVDLTVGGSMQIETELVTQPGGFKLPCMLEITRLDDQTPDAPDARFADCRVYRSVTTSIFNIKVAKISIRETRQWWYSPSVGATVKEVYTRDPVKFFTWSQDGYTATTTLAAFGIRGISVILPAPAIRDDTNLAAPPADVEAQRNWKWPAVAVCVVAAVIGLRRYARTRTPHQ